MSLAVKCVNSIQPKKCFGSAGGELNPRPPAGGYESNYAALMRFQTNSLPFADLSCFSRLIASVLDRNSSVWIILHGLYFLVYPFSLNELCEATLAFKSDVKPI